MNSIFIVSSTMILSLILILGALLIPFLVGCYIYSRLTCGITTSPICLVGKTALVTGGNSGIGFEICLNLASRGCRVIIADKDDSSHSKLGIIKRTRNPNILSKQVDFCSFKSVRCFAAHIVATEPKLDILVNNAGVPHGQGTTEDGLQIVMQVNYFSHFLLTHLLIGLLKKSAPSRVVCTSSSMAYYSSLSTEGLAAPRQCTNPFSIADMYSDSKLALIIACGIIANKLKGTGVTINSVHPGATHTNIFKKMTLIDSRQRFLPMFYNALASIFGKSAWEGSQTNVHLAIADEVEGLSGEYFSDCVKCKKPSLAYNKQFCQKIWDVSVECVKLTPEEIL